MRQVTVAFFARFFYESLNTARPVSTIQRSWAVSASNATTIPVWRSNHAGCISKCGDRMTLFVVFVQEFKRVDLLGRRTESSRHALGDNLMWIARITMGDQRLAATC